MKNISLKSISICISILLCAIFTYGQSIITTFAGSGPTGYMTGSYGGDGEVATSASLHNPCVSAFDAHGNLFIADLLNNRIRKVSTSGIITTVAGTGASGYTGDLGPATAAELSAPACVAFDASGNMYIAEQGNSCIRKVNTSGMISTVAGGAYGFAGDGGPATAASFDNPDHVKFDAAGNMYIGDWGNNRVRKVDLSGTITTIIGGGSSSYGGDGGPATAAGIAPEGILFDDYGNIFVCDASNNRIRKVNAEGVITTIAGNGASGDYGDDGPATAAELYFPSCLAYDPAGNIIIADEDNQVIRKINTSGIITTIAGIHVAGFSGDGSNSLSAAFFYPNAVVFDASGNLYVSDLWNNRIRKITFTTATSVNSVDPVLTPDIYPIPTNDLLNIGNLSKTTGYRLMDMQGNTVLKGTLWNPESTISLKALADGIYLLELSDGQSTYRMTRVIKD